MSAAAGLAAFTAGLFVFGLSGGAVFLLLTQAVTWRGWMAPLLPGLRLLAAATPLFGIALVALYTVAWPAYPWAEHPALGGYLSPLWTGVRLGALVGLFSLFGLVGALGLLNRRVAALGLIVLTLGLSIACVDWTISLSEKMKHGSFGLIVMTGWILTALALVCAVGAVTWDRAARATWSAVLLVLVVLWVYLQFMQYIVIWGTDLVPEAQWWLARAEPPWRPFLWATALLHAVVPVLCLALPALRSRPPVLLAAALSVLAGRALETMLWTLPALPERGPVTLGAATVVVPLLICAPLAAALHRREVRHG